MLFKSSYRFLHIVSWFYFTEAASILRVGTHSPCVISLQKTHDWWLILNKNPSWIKHLYKHMVPLKHLFLYTGVIRGIPINVGLEIVFLLLL